MLFNSRVFILFFLIVYGLYCLLGKRFKAQNLLLLIASYVFYGWWDYRFLFLLVLCTLTSYLFSLLVDGKTIRPGCFLKVSGILVGAAFLCTVVQWKAIRIHSGGLSAQWSALLPHQPQAYWLFVLSLIAAAAFGVLIYGISGFRKAGPKIHLAICVTIQVGVLAVFKYFNFFTDSFISFWNRIGLPQLPDVAYKIILPIGVSFFTFQAISYAVDVYRKKISACESLLEMGIFLSYFPHILSGPIERGAHFLPQFGQPRRIHADSLREGIWLIFWGFYKKIVVADNIAVLVNTVFNSFGAESAAAADGISCLLAVYGYAIQLYCDFSGYTDIARGLGRLMGFDVILNFNLPYLAVSPSDFWRRWHISLSSWLRDYLYIPLGGNRGGTWNMYRNLMLTMLLGGLWHGASWTFVLWGAFHGLILVVYKALNIRDEWLTATMVRRVVSTVIMFHLVCFGWLLFRAQDMATVGMFLKSIFGHFSPSALTFSTLKTMVFYCWFLVLFQLIQLSGKNLNPMKNMNWFIRLNVWIFVLMSILTLAPQKTQEFIYFAF